MSPADINSIHCPKLGIYGKHFLYLLSICLALSIYLLVRRSRSRGPIVDAESAIVRPTTLENSILEKSGLAFSCSTTPKQQTENIEFLDPFIDIQFIKPGPFTSGFLVAKADIEMAEKASGLAGGAVDDQKLSQDTMSQPRDLGPGGFFDDQPSPWRRHSYPLMQESNGSNLREDSQLDQVEHFQDEQDPGIIWRRRTMVFGTEP